MKPKSAAIFVIAVGVFLIGATHRFHDSAHAIGRISLRGGQVNHPVLLDEGKPLYTIIVTGTVMPPYRGDARVTLEGDRPPEYRIHNSEPAIDLGFFRRPRFRENTLYDLREKDKVALWVVMRPKGEADATAREEGSAASDAADLECCDIEPALLRGGQQGRMAPEPKNRLAIAFRDTRTGNAILKVPIVFGGKEGPSHDAE